MNLDEWKWNKYPLIAITIDAEYEKFVEYVNHHWINELKSNFMILEKFKSANMKCLTMRIQRFSSSSVWYLLYCVEAKL